MKYFAFIRGISKIHLCICIPHTSKASSKTWYRYDTITTISITHLISLSLSLSLGDARVQPLLQCTKGIDYKTLSFLSLIGLNLPSLSLVLDPIIVVNLGYVHFSLTRAFVHCPVQLGSNNPIWTTLLYGPRKCRCWTHNLSLHWKLLSSINWAKTLSICNCNHEIGDDGHLALHIWIIHSHKLMLPTTYTKLFTG